MPLIMASTLVEHATNQDFLIPPKPLSKTGQWADLLKRVMDTNQYGVYQSTFRASSVLHLHRGRSRSPAKFLKVLLKQQLPLSDRVLKSSILDGAKFLDLLLHLYSCLNLLESTKFMHGISFNFERLVNLYPSLYGVKNSPQYKRRRQTYL